MVFNYNVDNGINFIELIVKIEFDGKWFIFESFYSKSKLDIKLGINLSTQCNYLLKLLLVKSRFRAKINFEPKLPNIRCFHEITFEPKQKRSWALKWYPNIHFASYQSWFQYKYIYLAIRWQSVCLVLQWKKLILTELILVKSELNVK